MSSGKENYGLGYNGLHMTLECKDFQINEHSSKNYLQTS